MASNHCTDTVIGSILSGWRYDISGISPEMRKDYAQHFVECSHCRARQRFHRLLDVSLTVLTSLSAFFFLFALATLGRVDPIRHLAYHVLHLDPLSMMEMLESAAVAGLLFSLVAFLLVITATPVPIYLRDVAMDRARLLEERLPESMRKPVK